LRSSLQGYFPEDSNQHSKKRLPENNVAVHIGHAFLEENRALSFILFAEHFFKPAKKFNSKDDRYLELVVLELNNGVEIRIEIKEFQNAGSVNKILEDIQRVKQFYLVDPKGVYEIDSYYEKYAVLLAYSSNREIIEWWGNNSKEPPLNTRETKNFQSRKRGWRKLKEILRTEGNISGSCLIDEAWSTVLGYKEFHLLYLIFPL